MESRGRAGRYGVLPRGTPQGASMTNSRLTADERRRALLARPAQGSDGVELLQTDLERALLGDPSAPAAVPATATAAAIGAVRTRGWVELPAKRFPAQGV